MDTKNTKNRPSNKNQNQNQGITLGIDLGTTNSAVAVRRLESEIIANDQGDWLTPSCVHLKESSQGLHTDNVVVGKKALHWGKQEPKATITHIKRLMGRGFFDAHVQDIIQETKVGYNIQQSESGSTDSLVVGIPSHLEKKEIFEFSPEEISSTILRSLKDDAERELDSHVSRAVITVPAYFNDRQRHATMVAAKLAGFQDCSLLPEPSAAAISFGIDDLGGKALKTLAVFDFGGGTLDISILTLGGQNVVEQGKTGDMWLGGKDIDQALMKYILGKVERENTDIQFSRITKQMPSDKVLQAQIEMESIAEQAKIQLTHKDSVPVTISGLFEEDGLPMDFELILTQEELNAVVEPMIDRSMKLMEYLLKDLSLTTDSIDDVLLVGGSSQIPLLKTKMIEMFGEEKVHSHPRPMLTVVEGAAIYSQHKLGGSRPSHTSRGEKELEDILFTSAHDYFLKVPGKNSPPIHLVKKNEPLPMEREFEIQLESKDQKILQLQFLNLVNNDYEGVGRLWLSLYLSEAIERQVQSAKKAPVVILKVIINEDNLISVSCRLKDLADAVIQHSISRGKSNEQLYLRLEKGIQFLNQSQDEDSYWSKIDYEQRAISIVEDINRILHQQTEIVNKQVQSQAEAKLKTASELMERKVSIFGNIWFLEDFHTFCKYYLKRHHHYIKHHTSQETPFNSNDIEANKQGILKHFAQQISLLKKKNLTGDVEELRQMADKIFNEFRSKFPKEMNLYEYNTLIEDAKSLNMKKEAQEISNIVTQKSSPESTERLAQLVRSVRSQANSKSYNIDTGFTLS